MFKRTVTLVGLLLALTAPAALADSGTPAPSTAAPTTARGDVRHDLDRLHDRIQKVTAAFVKRCVDGKADAAKCRAAAEKGVDRLQKISGRIDDRIAKIKALCGGGTSTQPVPKRCASADEVVAKLHVVQGVVQELARRLQAYLSSGAATTTGGSGDTTGLESLDQLAADLAAAQAAAGN